jgi:Icc-related predicted phosphoesterase
MSIAICGDIHGFYELLVDYSKSAKEAGAAAVIQVGDFGVSSEELNRYRSRSLYPHLPVYYIEGNHEYFSQYEGITEVKEVARNIFFVPRGTVLKLDGKNIAFLGGAASIDKVWQGEAWDNRENITPQQVERMYRKIAQTDGPIDILVTHVPPHRVIKANFDNKGKLAFGVGLDWEDPNGMIVEKLWDDLGNPTMFCGHMHRSVLFDVDKGSRILNINELFFHPKYDVETILDQKTADEQKKRKAELDTVRNSRIVGLSGKSYDIPSLDKGSELY